ncbi:unnamed protein product [Brachionus calyciflorus]|uniref:DNA-directed DNA polymerase n=1 Tax=Brachionus calyciflorus TaxID=104777 RepID=A0A814JRH0_9BILA|nr:unnamed protein product [Brachionus calyciflorus]
MFSNFKDVDLLTEDHCKKITGWSKHEFIRFSTYIKQIKETKNRSKNQLIALYRYWLRKGVDQFTQAKLFSKDATQRKISKQEGDEYPWNDKTDEEKEKYIRNYFKREAFQLDADKIQKIKGLRSLMKMLLNSFWGRFGMNTYKTQYKVILDPL